MLKIILTSIVITLAACASPAQSNVNGSWNFSMNSPFGEISANVEILADGESLTGEFDMGGGRKWAIEQGSMSGNQIAFNINRDGTSMTYEMTGTLEGNYIAGIASAMGTEVEWSMSK
jgi:hypothetical protein